MFTAGYLQLHETQGIGREALRPCWRTRRAFLPKKRRCPTRIQEGLARPGRSPCLVCAQGAKEAVEGQKSYRRHHPYGLRNCCPPGSKASTPQVASIGHRGIGDHVSAVVEELQHGVHAPATVFSDRSARTGESANPQETPATEPHAIRGFGFSQRLAGTAPRWREVETRPHPPVIKTVKGKRLNSPFSDRSACPSSTYEQQSAS